MKMKKANETQTKFEKSSTKRQHKKAAQHKRAAQKSSTKKQHKKQHKKAAPDLLFREVTKRQL